MQDDTAELEHALLDEPERPVKRGRWEHPTDAESREHPTDAEPREPPTDAEPREDPIDVEPREHPTDVEPREHPVDAEPRNLEDQFLTACSDGHLERVKDLLDAGVDPICHYRRPLIEACKRGHVGVVKLLLEDERVDPNHVYEYGSALVGSVRADDLEMVKFLLSDARITNLSQALEEATHSKRTLIMSMLLADPRMDPKDVSCNSTIAYAICSRNPAHLRMILDDPRIELGKNGTIPVLEALYCNNMLALQELLMDPRLEEAHFIGWEDLFVTEAVSRLLLAVPKMNIFPKTLLLTESQAFLDTIQAIRAGAVVDLAGACLGDLLAFYACACFNGNTGVAIACRRREDFVIEPLEEKKMLMYAAAYGQSAIVRELWPAVLPNLTADDVDSLVPRLARAQHWDLLGNLINPILLWAWTPERWPAEGNLPLEALMGTLKPMDGRKSLYKAYRKAKLFFMIWGIPGPIEVLFIILAMAIALDS